MLRQIVQSPFLKRLQIQLDTVLSNQVRSQTQFFTDCIAWQFCFLHLFPLSLAQETYVDFNTDDYLLYCSITYRRHAIKNCKGISQYMHSFYRGILHLNIQLYKI